MEYTTPEYTFDVYSIDIKDIGRFYNYYLDVEYGSPSINGFWGADSGFSTAPVPTGINQVLPVTNDKKVYLVIENPAYFTWNIVDIAIAQPVRYYLRVNDVKPIEHTPNTSELVSLTKNQGTTARKIKISDPSILALSFIDKGADSPDLYKDGGNIVFRKLNGHLEHPEIFKQLDGMGSMDYYNILVEPGTYFFAFTHSGSAGTEYIEYSSKVTSLTSMNTLDKDPDENIPLSQFTNINLSRWQNMPESATEGTSYGGGYAFNVDENFWYYGYNVSLEAADNQGIFDVDLNPTLGSLWDDTGNIFTDYTEGIQPSNTSSVPFKTDGGTNGDAFIIGCEDKFSSIYVDVDIAAVDDMFVWSFWNGGNWENFAGSHQFNDGTDNGTCSLSQDGKIVWDPGSGNMDDWEPYSGGESTGDELPNTNGRDLYLIRCRCSNSGAATPEVKSISLKKYIQIRFDLSTYVAYDLLEEEKEFYYYRATWGNWPNTYFDNFDNVWSGTDLSHTINRNHQAFDAAMLFALSDMYIYDYNGSSAGIPLKFNDTLTFSTAMFERPDLYQKDIYNVGDAIPARYSEHQNLSDLPYDSVYTINATEKEYLYIEINPKTIHDWTQLNLQVINGTVVNSGLLFPSDFNYNTLDIYDATYDFGEYLCGTFAEYYATGGANQNMSMEFGFITEKAYLYLNLAPDAQEYNTIIRLDVRQFGCPIMIIGGPGLPLWALILIIVGSVAGAGALGYLIYKLLKKKYPYKFKTPR
ncbi:MAG: hypothetical protein GF364_10460 [Candidatus Lokiarchaeota archaeon]|nr:hypothetical protein [Candidatus Lokiarchaeota archaeon]